MKNINLQKFIEEKEKEFDKKFPSRRDCSSGKIHINDCQGCIDIIIEEPDKVKQCIKNQSSKPTTLP